MIFILIKSIYRLCLIRFRRILDYIFPVKKSSDIHSRVIPDVVSLLIINILCWQFINNLSCFQSALWNRQRYFPGNFLIILCDTCLSDSYFAVGSWVNLRRSIGCMILIIVRRIVHRGIFHQTGHICIRRVGNRILISLILIPIGNCVMPRGCRIFI